jgi:predicted acetyltransferase
VSGHPLDDNHCNTGFLTMHIQVLAAQASDAPRMANLLELYLHDFSEFVPSDIGEDGRFGYPYLAAYWQERERFPFLIRVDAALAGFALVRQRSLLSGAPDVMDIAEFFVLRGWRRRGIGRTAAHTLFRGFPGRWEVRVLEANVGALPFWEQTVAAYTQHHFQRMSWVHEGICWQVFRFESTAA